GRLAHRLPRPPEGALEHTPVVAALEETLRGLAGARHLPVTVEDHDTTPNRFDQAMEGSFDLLCVLEPAPNSDRTPQMQDHFGARLGGPHRKGTTLLAPHQPEQPGLGIVEVDAGRG